MTPHCKTCLQSVFAFFPLSEIDLFAWLVLGCKFFLKLLQTTFKFGSLTATLLSAAPHTGRVSAERNLQWFFSIFKKQTIYFLHVHCAYYCLLIFSRFSERYFSIAGIASIAIDYFWRVKIIDCKFFRNIFFSLFPRRQSALVCRSHCAGIWVN